VERQVLERLIEEGLSVRQIAARVGCGYGTVRHWMARHGLRTLAAERRELRRRGELPERFERECAAHGVQEFAVDGGGRYRCPRCAAAAVQKRRRKLKAIVVQEAGGACALCGYDAYIGALEFHHVDPAAKRFGLAQGGLTRSLEAVRAEARKCVLLCSNCHAEVEAGFRALP
jgi:5-methylcytosine-specific restriction endonuclease McrA